MSRQQEAQRRYWNGLADRYQAETSISARDFHFGPLLPGDDELHVLPRDISGLRCLELGCGAAQNSICLARRGAACTALDVSEAQLDHAARLARDHGVHVSLHRRPMEEPDAAASGAPARPREFDLVHSTYALPFVEDARRAVLAAAGKVAPGGALVLSTAHPLFHCEWMELDGEGFGAFVTDYFRPPPDSRAQPDGTAIAARAYPIGAVVEWLHEAGLGVERILEPEPLPLGRMTESEIAARVPYYSRAWHGLYPKLARIPVAAVYAARRLSAS